MIGRPACLSTTSLTAALGLVALAVILTGCGGGPAAYTFPLTFEPANDKNALAGYGERGYEALEQAPDSLKASHKAMTESASFFVIEAGGQQVIAAIEPDPLTLVVDTDVDNDLADETPIVHPDPKSPWLNFGSATIKVAGSDSGTVQAFGLFWPEKDVPPKLIVKLGGVYAGHVTLDGETFWAVVGDTTFNGRPNDLLVRGEPTDTIGIDYSGDEHFDLWDEIRPLPAITAHGQTIYSISVAADGSNITFTPVKPKIGHVEVTTPGAILSLFSEPGAHRVALRGEPMPLPVGEYNVYTIQILAWDDEDRRFRMQCISLPDHLRHFEIVEGETTVLELGPPMKAKALVTREGENVKVDVEVWGSNGERYFPYVRADSGGLEGWAGMRLYDEQGNELDSGGFEYG